MTFRTLELPEADFQRAADSFATHLRREGHSTLSGVLRGVLRDLNRSEQGASSAAGAATKRYLDDMALLPGAREVLELTRHLPRALVSNGPSDMQRAGIRQVDIEKYFQTVIVSGDEDVAVRKPNPRIFELACERLGVEPENTLMIGDNLEADVKGALAFGMQAVWLGASTEGVEQVRDTVELYDYLETKLAR